MTNWKGGRYAQTFAISLGYSPPSPTKGKELREIREIWRNLIEESLRNGGSPPKYARACQNLATALG